MLKIQLLLFLCVALCSYSTVVLCQEESDSEIRDRCISKIQQAFREANISETENITINTQLHYDFTCDTKKPVSFQPARNVHELTPWDIGIIAAMGDSVTVAVGAGAHTMIDDIIGFRWLSWSIGGHKDISEVSTLPNIIRKYNPEVKGFSVLGNRGLNVAVSGARARRMEKEASKLVMKIKKHYGPNVEALDNEWKLITMWIGGNDLCVTCDGTGSLQRSSTWNQPEKNAMIYVEEIRTALVYLQEHVKRVYINLVEIIDVTKLTSIEGWKCAIMHSVLCRCGTRARTKQLVSDTSRLYNIYLQNLLMSDEFDRDHFTVVLQPFFRNTEIPKLVNGKSDKSYFAPDCFHFSQKGHGLGGKYLWNNMIVDHYKMVRNLHFWFDRLEPAGKKTVKIDWNNIEDYRCISTEIPHFTTGNTGKKNMLSADLAGNDIQGEKSSENILSVLVVIGMSLVAMAVIAVTMGMICLKKKKRSSSEVELEKVQLLS